MNLSPTTKHYLISAVAGALLAAGTDATVYLTNGQPFSWPLLAAAVIGGLVLFGRDWLHNNAGAFLEGTAPVVAAETHLATLEQLATLEKVTTATVNSAIRPASVPLPTSTPSPGPVMVLRPPTAHE